MIKLPSAGQIELAKWCVFPWNGGVRRPRREEDTPEQRYGLAFHDVAEKLEDARGRGVDAGDLELYADLDAVIAARKLPTADAKRLRGVVPRVIDVISQDPEPEVHVELALAWDTRRGRAHPVDKPWDVEEGEMYGRADVVLVSPGEERAIRVRDWKTGSRARSYRPGRSQQLRQLALAAASHFGAERVVVEFALVDDDGAELVSAELTPSDLLQAEVEALDIADRVRQPPEPRPGPWCHELWCPIAAVCPATQTALAQVSTDLERFPLLGEPTSPEHAAYQRHRLPVLQAALEAQEELIRKAAARFGGIPVEGKPGVVWAPVEHDGNERVELTAEAEAELNELLGPEGSAEAIECSASKASIARGARAAAAAKASAEGRKPKRGEGKRLEEQALERLREIGALKRGAKFTKFEEIRRLDAGVEVEPREEAPAEDAEASE